MSLASKLVEYWTLDEASGSRVGAHASKPLSENSLFPPVPSATGLVYALAADFTATDQDALVRADDSDLEFGNTNRTVAAWVRVPTYLGLTLDIVGKAAGDGFEYILQAKDSGAGVVRFQIRCATGAGEAGATVMIDGQFDNGPSANTWYLVIGYHDATNDLIGIQSSANGFTHYQVGFSSSGVYQSIGRFCIGGNLDYFPSHMTGRIGPVMFFNDILTDGEVTQLYNGGAGLTYAALMALEAAALWEPVLPVMGGASVSLIPSGAQPK